LEGVPISLGEEKQMFLRGTRVENIAVNIPTDSTSMKRGGFEVKIRSKPENMKFIYDV